MTTIALPTEEELRALFQSERGYASEDQKLRSTPLPGCKSFPPHQMGNLFLQDVYWGSRQSGGFEIAYQRLPDGTDRGVLLRQYGGGIRDDVSDDEVGKINDFLRRVLSTLKNVRLPLEFPLELPNEECHIFYTEEDSDYAYYGKSWGNIFNLCWIEVIVLKNTEPYPGWEELFGFALGDSIALCLETFVDSHLPEDSDPVFYHDLKHRLLC